MTKTQRQRLVDELKQLQSSYAWDAICKSLDESALNAAYRLGDRPAGTDETNFSRGAIWALKTLKQLPANMASQIESDLLLEDSSPGETNDSANRR